MTMDHKLKCCSIIIFMKINCHNWIYFIWRTFCVNFEDISWNMGKSRKHKGLTLSHMLSFYIWKFDPQQQSWVTSQNNVSLRKLNNDKSSFWGLQHRLLKVDLWVFHLMFKVRVRFDVFLSSRTSWRIVQWNMKTIKFFVEQT